MPELVEDAKCLEPVSQACRKEMDLPSDDLNDVSWKKTCCLVPKMYQCLVDEAGPCTIAKKVAAEFEIKIREACVEEGLNWGDCSDN